MSLLTPLCLLTINISHSSPVSSRLPDGGTRVHVASGKRCPLAPWRRRPVSGRSITKLPGHLSARRRRWLWRKVKVTLAKPVPPASWLRAGEWDVHTERKQ